MVAAAAEEVEEPVFHKRKEQVAMVAAAAEERYLCYLWNIEAQNFVAEVVVHCSVRKAVNEATVKEEVGEVVEENCDQHSC